MNSIAPECTSFKHSYDKCFIQWFSSKFLVEGDTKLPTECDELFKKYQDCIRPKLNTVFKPEEEHNNKSNK